jgi:hypothetical protein
MRFKMLLFAIAFLASGSASAFAETAPEPKSVTVPITLDHDRVVIDVYLPLPDGSTKRVRGWVDTGDSELRMSQRAAKMMGLAASCDANRCTAAPPQAVMIGAMKIPFTSLSEVKIPLYAESDGTLMAPGMSAEITLPASILRNYDVLIDFPDREFSIGVPGALKFKGVKSKMLVDARTGLVQVSSRMENKNYNLLLDLGAPLSFLSGDLFTKFSAAHPDWPRMTGAIGPANMWGGSDETKWQLLRIDRIQFGPLYLTSIPVIAWPDTWRKLFELHSEISCAGMLGSEALMNYRVGLDYAHSTAYFDLGSTFKFPEFDVVGLILRPDPDTRFTIMRVADIDGEPSVPTGSEGVQPGDHLVSVNDIPVADSTMGQVWSLLEGAPGQEKKLVVERGGKQFTVVAKVQHFLAEADTEESKKKSK